MALIFKQYPKHIISSHFLGWFKFSNDCLSQSFLPQCAMYTISAKKINLIKTGVCANKYPDGSFQNQTLYVSYHTHFIKLLRNPLILSMHVHTEAYTHKPSPCRCDSPSSMATCVCTYVQIIACIKIHPLYLPSIWSEHVKGRYYTDQMWKKENNTSIIHDVWVDVGCVFGLFAASNLLTRS